MAKAEKREDQPIKIGHLTTAVELLETKIRKDLPEPASNGRAGNIKYSKKARSSRLSALRTCANLKKYLAEVGAGTKVVG